MGGNGGLVGLSELCILWELRPLDSHVGEGEVFIGRNNVVGTS